MEYGFNGTLVSSHQAALKSARVHRIQVSTPFFELTDAPAFFRFMPASKVELSIGPVGKPPMVTLTCELKTAREATTKDGTFLYATFQGGLDEKIAGKLGGVVGEQLQFRMTLPPDEQERLELEENARAEEV